MNNELADEFQSNIANADDKTTINTGRSKYSFSKSWVENDALKDILVGMIADDLNQFGK